MPKLSKRPEVSLALVIPVYNEELVVPFLVQALIKIKPKLPTKTQIILVDDGSTDRTYPKLKTSQLKDYFSVKIIQLTRNFGHQAALIAGLELSRSEITVTLDGDLQHPLELIPTMLKHHAQGADIVQTQRQDTAQTGLIKRFSAQAFYSLFEFLSQTKIGVNTSDFRSMNRQALKALLAMPEQRKFLRGLVNWLGFKSVTLAFKVKPRAAGQTKYSWQKMINLSLAGLTSFSVAPLYLSIILSLVFLVFSLLYAIYVLYVKLIIGSAISGWSSVMMAVLVLSCLIFLMFSLFGIYLSAIYDEVKRRPMYVIKKTSHQPS